MGNEHGIYIYLTWKFFHEQMGSGGDAMSALTQARRKAEQKLHNNRSRVDVQLLETTLNNFLKCFRVGVLPNQNIIEQIAIKNTTKMISQGAYEHSAVISDNLNVTSYVRSAINKLEAQGTPFTRADLQKLYDIQYDTLRQLHNIRKAAKGKAKIEKMVTKLNQSKAVLSAAIHKAGGKLGLNNLSGDEAEALNILKNAVNIPPILKGRLAEVIVAAAIAWSKDVAIDASGKAIEEMLKGTARVTKNKNNAGGNTVNGKNIKVTRTSANTIDVSAVWQGVYLKSSIKNYSNIFEKPRAVSLVSGLKIGSMLDNIGLNASEKSRIFNIMSQHRTIEGDSSDVDMSQITEDIKMIAYQQALMGRSMKDRDQADIFILLDGETAKVINVTDLARKTDPTMIDLYNFPSQKGFTNAKVGKAQSNMEDAHQRSAATLHKMMQRELKVKQNSATII